MYMDSNAFGNSLKRSALSAGGPIHKRQRIHAPSTDAGFVGMGDDSQSWKHLPSMTSVISPSSEVTSLSLTTNMGSLSANTYEGSMSKPSLGLSTYTHNIQPASPPGGIEDVSLETRRPWWLTARIPESDGSSCHYCERAAGVVECERCEHRLCDMCVRGCERCATTSCPCCCVVDFDCPVERTLCAGCYDERDEMADGAMDSDGDGVMVSWQ